jgi:hypothetical protein
MALLLAHVGTHVTRFTGTKVQILKRMALLLAHGGAQFTRFTGTKVQILQQKRAATGARRYLQLIYLLYWYKSTNAAAEALCW